MNLLETLNMAPIIAICCAAVLVVILILVNLFFFLRRKKTKVRIDQGFMHKLLEALGSKTNIVDAKTVNGRLILEVKDVDIVAFDTLKELSAKGVFITNQTIKMLFPYDSETIAKEIKNSIHTK